MNNLNQIKTQEAIFRQIYCWLSSKSHEKEIFSFKFDIAQRRGNKLMKSYQNENTGKISILKTFEIGKSEESARNLCYDTMVPILLNSNYFLKFKKIFMQDQV